MHAAVSL